MSELTALDQPRSPIRTRWVGGPPVLVQPGTAQASMPACTWSALLEGVGLSLRRGHSKVAARRFLMLELCDVPVPDEVRRPCEAIIERLQPRELEQMRCAASAWRELLR